jgi:hypothetical protein
VTVKGGLSSFLFKLLDEPEAGHLSDLFAVPSCFTALSSHRTNLPNFLTQKPSSSLFLFHPALSPTRMRPLSNHQPQPFDMAGKRDKGKAPMRRVSIAEEEDSPRSPLASPGPSNFSRHTSHGSPASSHTSASGSQSHAKSKDKKPTTAAASVSTPAPASILQTPVPQFAGTHYGNWLPYPGAHAVMAALQPAAPAPVNPPDELGPPPPPPPPPAIPPVVNPFGIHFQPQVPGTEMGPMMHRYMPRHDLPGVPGMFMQGHQMPGYMVSALIGL